MKRQFLGIVGLFWCFLLFFGLSPSVYGAALIWEGKMAKEILKQMVETEPYLADFEFGLRGGVQSCILHFQQDVKVAPLQCEMSVEPSDLNKRCETSHKVVLDKHEARGIAHRLNDDLLKGLMCWRPSLLEKDLE